MLVKFSLIKFHIAGLTIIALLPSTVHAYTSNLPSLPRTVMHGDSIYILSTDHILPVWYEPSTLVCVQLAGHNKLHPQ